MVTVIKVVVYIDVLMCVNFIIDYFLLSLTAHICKTKLSFARQLAASAAGAVFSLTVLADIPKIGAVILQFAESSVIVFFAFGIGKLKIFSVRIICFYLASFLFSGAVSAVIKLFSPYGLMVNNGVVYMDISAVVLVTLSAVIYCLITLFARITSRNRKKTCTVIIKSDGNTIKLNTLVDSGNKLKEPFSEKRVIIIDKRFKTDILPQNRTERVIPYSTVGGVGTLTGFKTDGVYISHDGILRPLDIYAAFAASPLGNDIDAVIGEDAF